MRRRSHDDTIPEETAYCHSCGFKHTRRPDWLCPRCGMPASTDPPPRRTAAAADEEEPAAYPLGSTVAGAVMAANAVALLGGFLRFPGSEHRWAILGAAALATVLALELLLRVPAGRWAAAVVVVVIALVVSEGAVRERLPDLFKDPLPAPARAFVRCALAGLQLPEILALPGLGAGCLLLVIGRPRVARIAAGVALAAPLVVLEVVRAFGL